MAAPSVEKDSQTRPAEAFDIGRYQETLLTALGKLQPVVVLFSLSVLIASFTRSISQDASDWALVAASGFAVALLISALFIFIGPEKTESSDLIFAILTYLGIVLGFASLFLVVLLLAVGNPVLAKALQFLMIETWGFAMQPLAVGDLAYLTTVRIIDTKRGKKNRFYWWLAGKALIACMALLVTSPVLWLLPVPGSDFFLIFFFVALAVVLSVHGWRELVRRGL